MSLPDLELARVRRYIEQRNERIPPEARDELRVEADVDAQSITIVECRPPWNPARAGVEWSRHPVARLRYVKSSGRWTLYWRDRNSAFHRYNDADPGARLEELLAEIDRDPTGIFWG